MNIQIRNSIIFLAAIIAILGSVYYGTVQKGMLRKVPHFVLSDYSGHPFDSALLEGTPYVVNVWASWCIFCKWEIVDFATVHRKFPGVPVIAINRGESVDVAKQFTDERHLAAGIVFLLNPQDHVRG
ncbi:MAG: hypothetical protein COU35_00835 [Candidatus Magasanikbacteria bacterium CG10_big_fil_rev_8_21_14_0_10_47_10]|uniref:Thioredoxin domain-containing protein n=1 Tax=Candidatus Magasanikbacteria bacterium CG10_big_fil_rev_8_21_14_0_10_47_10 TaxID=1974652 RepID=A0A2H0TRC8_9BACT|nr:MAG: hypothetical protein COU35_00835 [Candidatus Magasanikbacteria bacterium CG10_big_fil_rev_8_21_14_0_10_47_10]